MEIGVVYPQNELRGDPTAVRRFGRAVEDLGFDHLGAYDHVLGAVHADRTPPLHGPLHRARPVPRSVRDVRLFGRHHRAAPVHHRDPGPSATPDGSGGTAGSRRRASVGRSAASRCRYRLEPCRVSGARAGLRYSWRQRGGADRAAPPPVHRTGRRLLGPLRPDRPGFTRAEASAGPSRSGLVDRARRHSIGPPGSRMASSSSVAASITPSTPGIGCGIESATSAGLSTDFGGEYVALSGGDLAELTREIEAWRECGWHPCHRSSRWASASTLSTTTSTS